MLLFSKLGTVAELIAAVNALPEFTETACAEDVANAKAGALLKLNRLKTNGAQINLRVNSLNQWSQTEIQVAGQTVKITPPAP